MDFTKPFDVVNKHNVKFPGRFLGEIVGEKFCRAIAVKDIGDGGIEFIITVDDEGKSSSGYYTCKPVLTKHTRYLVVYSYPAPLLANGRAANALLFQDMRAADQYVLDLKKRKGHNLLQVSTITWEE